VVYQQKYIKSIIYCRLKHAVNNIITVGLLLVTEWRSGVGDSTHNCNVARRKYNPDTPKQSQTLTLFLTLTLQGVSKVPGQVKFRKDLRRKMEFKLRPPLKSVAALPCEKWVVNYTASQHCQFSSQWWKRLITVNVHEECYFFIFLYIWVFVICLKCPLRHTCVFWVVNSNGQCMRQCALFNVVPNFFFITERNE